MRGTGNPARLINVDDDDCGTMCSFGGRQTGHQGVSQKQVGENGLTKRREQAGYLRSGMPDRW